MEALVVVVVAAAEYRPAGGSRAALHWRAVRMNSRQIIDGLEVVGRIQRNSDGPGDRGGNNSCCLGPQPPASCSMNRPSSHGVIYGRQIDCRPEAPGEELSLAPRDLHLGAQAR